MPVPVTSSPARRLLRVAALVVAGLAYAGPSAAAPNDRLEARSSLNVRASPGTEAPVLGYLRPGDLVREIGRREPWVQIAAGPLRGWVHGEFVVPRAVSNRADPAQAARDAFVLSDFLDVRAAPAADAPLVHRVFGGDRLVVGERHPPWVQVGIAAGVAPLGWARADQIRQVGEAVISEDALTASIVTEQAPEATKAVLIVEADVLNLRAHPDDHADVLARLEQGTRLVETESLGPWLAVHVDAPGGISGWVHGDFVRLDVEPVGTLRDETPAGSPSGPVPEVAAAPTVRSSVSAPREGPPAAPPGPSAGLPTAGGVPPTLEAPAPSAPDVPLAAAEPREEPPIPTTPIPEVGGPGRSALPAAIAAPAGADTAAADSAAAGVTGAVASPEPPAAQARASAIEPGIPAGRGDIERTSSPLPERIASAAAVSDAAPAAAIGTQAPPVPERGTVLDIAAAPTTAAVPEGGSEASGSPEPTSEGAPIAAPEEGKGAVPESTADDARSVAGIAPAPSSRASTGDSAADRAAGPDATAPLASGGAPGPAPPAEPIGGGVAPGTPSPAPVGAAAAAGVSAARARKEPVADSGESTIARTGDIGAAEPTDDAGNPVTDRVAGARAAFEAMPEVAAPPTAEPERSEGGSRDLLVIVAELLNLRDAPSAEAPVLARLGKGARVFELSRRPGWVEVNLGPSGPSGWIDSDYVEVIDSGPSGPAAAPAVAATPMYVTTERLNVRAAPSESAEVVGNVERGDALGVIGRTGDWARIAAAPGEVGEGWVSALYLRAEPPSVRPDSTDVAEPDVNRAAPPAAAGSSASQTPSETIGSDAAPEAPRPAPEEVAAPAAVAAAPPPGAPMADRDESVNVPPMEAHHSAGPSERLADHDPTIVAAARAALEAVPPAAPRPPTGPEDTEPAAGARLVTIADLLNLRDAPSAEAPVVARLGKGARVLELSRRAGWVEVGLGPSGPSGWIHSDYVEPVGPEVPGPASAPAGTPMYVVAERLKVRAAPSESAEVVGQVERGSALGVIGRAGDWARIAAPPGGVGEAWVSARYLGAEPPSTNAGSTGAAGPDLNRAATLAAAGSSASQTPSKPIGSDAAPEPPRPASQANPALAAVAAAPAPGEPMADRDESENVRPNVRPSEAGDTAGPAERRADHDRTIVAAARAALEAMPEVAAPPTAEPERTEGGSGDRLVVVADLLNLRDAPSAEAPVVARLSKGARVLELSRRAGWVEVGLGPSGPRGWIDSDYVEPVGLEVPGPAAAPAVAATPMYVTAERLNVRAAPSESAEVVGQVQRGDALGVIGRVGSWARIGAPPGGVGEAWVHTNHLGTAPPSASPAAIGSLAAAAAREAASGGSEFERFSREFKALSERFHEATGETVFSAAEEEEPGVLLLKATPYWLSGSEAERESNVQTMLRIWKKANDERSVVVIVLDGEGHRHMVAYDF